MRDVSKLSLPELTELYRKVQLMLPRARAREIEDVRREMAELAAKRGMSITDVLGIPGKARKVAPKWIDSKTGVTWTGRGRMPRGFDKSRSQPAA